MTAPRSNQMPATDQITKNNHKYHDSPFLLKSRERKNQRKKEREREMAGPTRNVDNEKHIAQGHIEGMV